MQNRRWRRWNEQKAIVSEREGVLKALLDDDVPAKLASPPTTGLLEEFSFLQDDAAESIEDHDAAWAARLARHERLNGLRGVFAVWRARRKAGYRLPTGDSANAHFLWATFAKHPRLVGDIIEHAAELQQELGETYPCVYSVVMDHWLKRKPAQALEYNHQMLTKLRLRKLPLRKLACSVRNYGHTAQEALLYIYRISNERNMYDEVVPRLIDCGNILMARRWHNLCTLRNDLPSDSTAANTVVQMFTAESASLMNPEVRFDKTKRENPKLNKDLMQRLLGRDTAPVRFEDSFTARMFATKTIQIETIIKGLIMVGVNEVGPQAVATMAWRTQPMTDLALRFEQLRAAGIALQGNVFSLALEKFAMEQKWDLVRSILESDQHPDVYGDAETQRSLLTYYLDQKDMEQTQRTLAILTLFHNDPSTESWNLLLQLCIERSRPQQVYNTLLEMRSHGIALSSESMASVRHMLARRQRGHRPSAVRGFDDLRFVARFYMTALEAGMTRIPPEAWYEIMRRFGMQGRFRELKRVLLWLISWYAPRHSAEFPLLPRSPFFDEATDKMRRLYPVNRRAYWNFPHNIRQENSKLHPIRLLVPPSLQQGILVWGLRAALLHNAPLEQSMLSPTAAKLHHRPNFLRKGILKRLDWGVGLKLLVQLRALGVHVHPHTVTKTMQAQFINLFGHGHSLIKANRIMERTNNIPYAEFVRGVNEIWGSPLFSEPKRLGDGRLERWLWHPRFRRRVDGRTEVSFRKVFGEREGKEGDGHGHDGSSALQELGKAADAYAQNAKARKG